jgi:hypothetical protein
MTFRDRVALAPPREHRNQRRQGDEDDDRRDAGWQVFIIDSDGIRYQPSDFDRLASSGHAAGRTTQRRE